MNIPFANFESFFGSLPQVRHEELHGALRHPALQRHLSVSRLLLQRQRQPRRRRRARRRRHRPPQRLLQHRRRRVGRARPAEQPHGQRRVLPVSAMHLYQKQQRNKILSNFNAFFKVALNYY